MKITSIWRDESWGGKRGTLPTVESCLILLYLVWCSHSRLILLLSLVPRSRNLTYKMTRKWHMASFTWQRGQCDNMDSPTRIENGSKIDAMMFSGPFDSDLHVFACHMFQVPRVPWCSMTFYDVLWCSMFAVFASHWGSKKSAVCSITGWMPSTARSLGIDLYDETSAVPQSFGGETGETGEDVVKHLKHT